MLAAIIVIENAVVEKGTLYVIPVIQQQRQPQHPARRRLSPLFRHPDRLGPEALPPGQPRRLAPRPMARSRRLHPLSRTTAPVLHRRPQHEPDLAGPARRAAHGAGDLRGHGAHAAGEDRRRHRPPRRRDHVPGDELHRRPGKVVQDRHPGLPDRQGHGGFRQPRRTLAVGFPRPVPPGDRRPFRDRCPSCSRRPSPSSTSRPGRRRSSFCSTARTRSCSAWPGRRSSSSPTTSRGWPHGQAGRPAPVGHPGDPPAVLQEDARPGDRRPGRSPLRRRRQERRRPLLPRPREGRTRGPSSRIERGRPAGGAREAVQEESVSERKIHGAPALRLRPDPGPVHRPGRRLAPPCPVDPAPERFRPRPAPSILVGRDASTDGSIMTHPHLRLRRLRLDLAPRPRRRPQARVEMRKIYHISSTRPGRRRRGSSGTSIKTNFDGRRDPRGPPHLRLPPRHVRLHEREAGGHRRIDHRLASASSATPPRRPARPDAC